MRTAVIGTVFLALLLGTTGSAALAGQMYWVWYNIDSGSIVRANENGTGVESIFGCTFCDLGPLAIDDGAGNGRVRQLMWNGIARNSSDRSRWGWAKLAR